MILIRDNSTLITVIIFMSAIPLGKDTLCMQTMQYFLNFTNARLVKQTSSILLQGVPNSVPLQDVNEALLKVNIYRIKKCMQNLYNCRVFFLVGWCYFGT